MKKFIIAVALTVASVSVFAHTWVSSSDAGGQITLRAPDYTCPVRYDEDGNQYTPAHVLSQNVNFVLGGCVVLTNPSNNTATVRWNNGITSILNLNNFVQID